MVDDTGPVLFIWTCVGAWTVLRWGLDKDTLISSSHDGDQTVLKVRQREGGWGWEVGRRGLPRKLVTQRQAHHRNTLMLHQTYYSSTPLPHHIRRRAEKKSNGSLNKLFSEPQQPSRLHTEAYRHIKPSPVKTHHDILFSSCELTGIIIHHLRSTHSRQGPSLNICFEGAALVAFFALLFFFFLKHSHLHGLLFLTGAE